MPPPDDPTDRRTDGDQLTFQLIAEGLSRLVGFGAAAINIADGREMVIVAVAGVEGAVRKDDGAVQGVDEMIGTRWSVELLTSILSRADDWGRFKFVPQGTIAAVDRSGWETGPASPPPADDPGAWHPGDELIAPVYDADGALCAAVTLGDPVDRRRPTAAQLRLMDKYVALLDRAISATVERERLAARIRHLDTARAVVRRAAAQRTMRAVLGDTGEALRRAFRADAVRLRLLKPNADVTDIIEDVADVPLDRDPRMVAITERAARPLWNGDGIGIVDVRTPGGPFLTEEDNDYAREYLRRNGHEVAIYAALGAGPECLGSLTLMRAVDAPPFRPVELDAARDIAVDLGRMLLNVRNLDHERRLVRQLRDLDAFKTDLIARVADEFGGPLDTIVAEVATLDPAAEPDRDAVARLHASARRMARMADHLLVLARTTDPPASSGRFDLAALVSAIVAHEEPDAPPRVHTKVPSYAVMVPGVAEDIERVVAALLANARAYTPGGRSVTVSVETEADEVVLTVADTGIGISPDDLDHVFEEFFRSADPRVRAHPGTGLGLSIVDRIVRRHDGRVEVQSAPGKGTTVRVHLPRLRGGLP